MPAMAPAARAAPAELPGAVPTAPLMTGSRHLLAKLPTAATSDGLLLPTNFNGGATASKGPGIITGPVTVVDGAAVDLASRQGIPVTSITYACDGTIYAVNAVPLPCNFLGRRAVVRAVAPAVPKALPVGYTISADLVNTTAIPGAVANVTSAATAVVAAPVLSSIAAGAVLAAILL